MIIIHSTSTYNSCSFFFFLIAIFVISIPISLSSSSESHDDENGGLAHIPGIFNSTPTTSAHHADINVSNHNPQPESEESESISSILEVIESDESTQIDLDCESTFDQPHSDSSFINLVMQSLDVTHSDTLSDLQRPSCRVLFDAHCSKLSSTQMKALLSTDSGVSILRQGQCLELFPDFSTFTLSDFALFPALTVGKIRDLSTVPADLLLQLINLQGYSHVGHLNRFPSAVGDRVFHSTAWLNDLHIWELFTIEGILGMNTDNNNAHRFNFRTITKYAAFLFNRIRFEKLLSSSDSLIDNAPLLTRWSIQSEEFLLFYIEYISARRSPGLTPLEVDQARRIVNLYTETRLCLFQSATNHKWSYLQKINKTRKETEQLIKLDILIEFISTPLTWRFSKALQALKPVNTNNIPQSLTPMTRSLISALKDFPSLLSFYHSNADCFNRSTDEIFGHFILLHDIKSLTDLTLPTTHQLSDAVPTSQSTNNPHNHNNNNNILVTLRRLLLQLLSPHSPTSFLVQDALTFIFSTSSTNSNNNSNGNSNGNSFEVTRWFRQAHDLNSFYIFDHLIRHFSHEFDVAQEIAILLKNPAIRHRLFHESKSLLVKLLAALNSSSVTVSWNLVHDFPETVDNDIPNVVSLLHLDPMKSLLLNPSSNPRRHTPLEEEEIQNHNSLINTSLQASLRFLQALTPITPPSAVLIGFLKADFRVQFSDDLGVDAGGLRRTWLSSLFKIFGDELRLLFPENPAQTGRLPAPFIQPELFSFLGLLHGKALQIGVKPDWFFSHDFAINFLLQQPAPPSLELEEEEEPGKVDLDLVELLYPNVFEIFDLILQLPAEEEALDYFNSSNFPSISSLTKSHHSFSSHFVFDAHHFAKMTTPISTVTVETLNEIKSYRSAIISHLTSNLLTSRQHYWTSLSLFFSPDFLPSISPQFIFNLLNPPQVKIDEIISKMEFSDTCNTIWIIDDHHVTTDDDVGEGNSNTIETEKKTNDLKSNKNNENNQNNIISSASPNALLEDSEDNNDDNTHTPSEQHALLNITAREAFLRILRSSYTSPKRIESLLSFTTGSLQIPPAGLDDLKFRVHCYQTPSPAERLSKSHTCSNTLDFHSSLKMSDTMEAFELSILSSSGFGFS